MSCDCSGFQWCRECKGGRRVYSTPYTPKPPTRYCGVCHSQLVGGTKELRQHRAEAHGWIKGRQPPPPKD